MITIYHNPECGTSRNLLQIIRDAGYSPQVIEYVKEGWDREQLDYLLSAAEITPRQALRTTKSPADALGLLDESVTDDVLFEAMLAHPILVNRPMVCMSVDEYEVEATRVPKRPSQEVVALCRPSDAILDILPLWPTGPYQKEDGTLIIDTSGQRVLHK